MYHFSYSFSFFDLFHMADHEISQFAPFGHPSCATPQPLTPHGKMVDTCKHFWRRMHGWIQNCSFFFLFQLHMHSQCCPLPFWLFCAILPPLMGDPTPPLTLPISIMSDDPIWPKNTIPTGILDQFFEKNLYVVILPIFSHLGVREPPLAGWTVTSAA